MKKKKTTEKAMVKENSPLTTPQFKSLGGSNVDEFNRPLMESVLSTVWVSENEAKEVFSRARIAAMAALVAIGPTNEIEGMLAAQIVATHNGAMECYRRAMFPNQTFEGRQQNLSYGSKLSRTCASLLEALDRQRGKGQQKVTVEHVHVHQGGQAIVGNVQRGVRVQQNQSNNAMQNHLPMHLSPRCGAHSRRSGKACRNGAMKNGRCRMHGGKSTGAPKGNRNALKHGNYTLKEQARRAAMKYLLRWA